MVFKIYTYSTSETKAKYLFESAKFHGVEIENLAPSTEWNGLQDKLIAMKKKLEQHAEDDIVCFVDAYDVIVNTDMDTMLKTFTDSKCEILFGGETNLDPPVLKEHLDKYPESPTIFRFINTGVYIGYVRAIRKIIEWGNFLEMNDQEYINRYFLENQDVIKIDYYANYVLNMYRISWSDLKIVEGQLVLPAMNVIPCFIHFNGMSYLDSDKDYTRQEDGGYSFMYDYPYDTTFSAIMDSKRLTQKHSVMCILTGSTIVSAT